eukprot:10751261-Prorocentrum_lima.AAC.1
MQSALMVNLCKHCWTHPEVGRLYQPSPTALLAGTVACGSASGPLVGPVASLTGGDGPQGKLLCVCEDGKEVPSASA